MNKQGRYAKVFACMYADEKYRRLSPVPPCGRFLWHLLICGKQVGIIPGLIEISEVAFAHETGWTLRAFRKAFQEILDEGLAKADWKSNVLWVPNAIKFNPPASPNVIRSWRGPWRLIPECDLKNEAYVVLASAVGEMGDGFVKAFQEAIPKAIAFDEGIPEAIDEDVKEDFAEDYGESAATAAATAPTPAAAPARATKKTSARGGLKTSVKNPPRAAAAAAAGEEDATIKSLVEELEMPENVRDIAEGNSSLSRAVLTHCRWRFADQRGLDIIGNRQGYMNRCFREPEKCGFTQDDEGTWHTPPGQPRATTRGAQEHPRVAEQLQNIHEFDALPRAEQMEIEAFVREAMPLYATASSGHPGFRMECVAVMVQWKKEGKL